MSSGPTLSVVVLSWNTRELTLACLRALHDESPAHRREVIVVDNGSEDGSADAIAEQFPEVRLIRNDDNRLYAAGNNQGAAVAAGEFVVTLNSDTEVRAGARSAGVELESLKVELAREKREQEAKTASIERLQRENAEKYYCNRAQDIYDSYLKAPRLYRTTEAGVREYLSSPQSTHRTCRRSPSDLCW